jgi:quercetin dioxygenase-like cupin family protein
MRKKITLMSSHLATLLCLCVSSSVEVRAQVVEHETQIHHKIVPLLSVVPGGLVSGDPGKPGAQFVIRITNQQNQVVPVHWHPEDEHITVVKGVWYVGSGDRFDRKALKEMNVGDYVFMPKEMRHFGWSKTDTIIQVHGIGPFKIIPVGTAETLSGWKITADGLIRDETVSAAFRFKPADRVRSKNGAGTVLMGYRLPDDKITQYEVQRTDGRRVFEFEEDLSVVPRTTRSAPGALSGRWTCFSRGLPQGDMESTMFIEHDGKKATGVVTWATGGAALVFETPEANLLNFSMNHPQGRVTFEAKHDDGKIHGVWREHGKQGDWTCQK